MQERDNDNTVERIKEWTRNHQAVQREATNHHTGLLGELRRFGIVEIIEEEAGVKVKSLVPEDPLKDYPEEFTAFLKNQWVTHTSFPDVNHDDFSWDPILKIGIQATRMLSRDRTSHRSVSLEYTPEKQLTITGREIVFFCTFN